MGATHRETNEENKEKGKSCKYLLQSHLEEKILPRISNLHDFVMQYAL